MFHQNSLKFLGVSLYITLKTNEGTCNLSTFKKNSKHLFCAQYTVFFAWVKLKLFGPSTQTSPWSYSLAAIISHTFTWKDNCYVHAQYLQNKITCA